MTAGLQVWDASGNLILDATTRAGRILSIQSVGAGGGGSYGDARLAQGQPFAVFQPSSLTGPGSALSAPSPPNISISGTTVSWSSSGSNNAAGNIIIGVY